MPAPKRSRCRCAELDQEVLSLRQRIDELVAENEKLAAGHELDLKEIDALKKRLEKQERAGKRQASPFSKGPPKKNPKMPCLCCLRRTCLHLYQWDLTSYYSTVTT